MYVCTIVQIRLGSFEVVAQDEFNDEKKYRYRDCEYMSIGGGGEAATPQEFRDNIEHIVKKVVRGSTIDRFATLDKVRTDLLKSFYRVGSTKKNENPTPIETEYF